MMTGADRLAFDVVNMVLRGELGEARSVVDAAPLEDSRGALLALANCVAGLSMKQGLAPVVDRALGEALGVTPW